MRQVGRLAAHQCRLVRGRDHHHRAREAGGAEIVLQELLHFAAALADQTDDGDVGADVAGHHGQQDRLADARAREDAHALAAADRGEGVERAHAKIERLADAAARMRGRRRGPERIWRRPERQRPSPSIGSPMALTTRPSQPSHGRIAPAAVETTALQPRRTPSRAANGIASALLPEKPTTSHGIRASAVSMVSREPTDMAWIGPATSTISPRTPTTRPYISTPSISLICSASAFMTGARPSAHTN